MAQIIKHRRGSITNVGTLSPVNAGEIVLGTGSIGNLVGPVLFVGDSSSYKAVPQLYYGSSAPDISTYSQLEGVSFYNSTDKNLYILKAAGNTRLDLSGAVSGSAINPLSINTGLITGSNLYLSGNAVIDGNITLGGNITVGNADTDFVTFGADISSSIIPDINAAFDLGSSSKNWKNLNVNNVRGYNSLFGTPSSDVVTFVVTVSSKTTNHRYYGTGSASGYFIDGVESPFLTLLPGKTYRFSQSDGSNGSHQILFYYDAAKLTQYTTNVTTNGTAGSAGAYTQIIVTDTTPVVLHYQCINHGYMGNSAQFNSNVVDTPYQIIARNGINVTGSAVFAQASGSFSGSFIGNGAGLTGLATSLLVYGDGGLSGSINLLNQNLKVLGTPNEIETTLSLNAGSDGFTVQIGLPNDVTIGGDITVGGNDIKSSGGSIAVTLSGSDVTVAGDLQVSGNDIKSSTGNSVITLSGTDATFNQNVTVTGNLIVNGTSTIVNSTTVEIGDNIISLNGSGVANAGLVVRDVTSPNTVSGSLLWDSTNDYWKAGALGSEKRIAVQNANSLTTNALIFGNVSSEIVSMTAPSAADQYAKWDGSAWTMTNVIDGGTF